MQAGKLNKRITIKQQSTIQNSYGEPENSWITFATVFASINPILGREYFASDVVNAEISAKINIRYLPGLHPKMKIVFGDKEYNIKSIINVSEKNKELILMCKEVI